MDDRPPGLLSRRMFPIDQGRVIVEERWDIEVPGCPMIRHPWGLNALEVLPGQIVVRQREMTDEEYRNSNIPLFNSKG